MAELNPVLGSEQGGRRPILIIQNDLGNQFAPTVIAVPLTGSCKKTMQPTHVIVPKGEGGLWRTSIILCEQVRTLEKTRLLHRLGTLDTGTLKKVEDALRISLELPVCDQTNT